MDIELKKLDEVWTTDEKLLGTAQRLLHRTRDINPKLQLFATYLLVANLELGDSYYVPTDYITGRDPVSGHIQLNVPIRTVLRRTWTRMPQFVLEGNDRRQELPELTPELAGGVLA